jgi:hypothetical protein
MGYEIYGLRENPFPSGGAILNPESQDPRENGSIFSVNARRTEIDEFERKFVGTATSFADRLRCGFLWAEGDRATGRGMGKTALAVYMKHKINRDYGTSYFDGRTSFFCIYVSFSEQMPAKMGLLYQAALNSLVKERIFEQVASRIDYQALVSSGVSKPFANAVASGTVRRYLEEDILHHSLGERYPTKDWRYDPDLKDIFLNQATWCFKAAGFLGAILVVDDIENLTDRSTPKKVESFVKDFGTAFFRSGNEAANSRFYTVILTTHRQSADKISQAWTVAGLSAAFPLVPGGHASLLTRKPDLDQAVDMAVQYLKAYRVPTFSGSTDYHPFTLEALQTVVSKCDNHPRRFLSRLNRIMVEAVSKGVELITPEFTNSVPEMPQEISTLPTIEDL